MSRVALTEPVLLSTFPVSYAKGTAVYVCPRGTALKEGIPKVLSKLWTSEEGGAEVTQPLVTDEGGRPESGGAYAWVEGDSYDLIIDGQRVPWEAAKGLTEAGLTEAEVKALAEGVLGTLNAFQYKGAKDCSANPKYPAANAGDTYMVSVAGKIGGASGTAVEAGDLLLCDTDGSAEGTQAEVGAKWDILQVAGIVAAEKKRAEEAEAAEKKRAEEAEATKQASLGFTAENVANKDTTGTLGTSDTKYPSQKAVKTYADAGDAAKQPLDADLTAIAALAPADAAIMVRSGGSWAALAKGGIAQELVVRSDGTLAWVDPVVYNIEAWGAKPDAYFTDGVAAASTTFTSATANFTAEDVGKNIVILKAGASSYQDHHTTIAEVKSATEVKLTNAAGREQEKCRFLISRSGDQTTPIKGAIEAAFKAGGGIVYGPGPGYLHTGITLKNRIWLKGAGHHATMFHLAGSSNKPVVQNDHTSNESAQSCYVSDCWLDGNRARQSDWTTTLAAKYTVGATTLSLTAEPPQPSGSLLIGTNRLSYESVEGAGPYTLKGVVGGVEGTTDAEGASGATVTQHVGHGVYFAPVPFNTNPTYAESTDVPYHLIADCYVKNCKGDGTAIWGWSEVRVRNVLAHYCDHFAHRPGFDSFYSDTTADTAGRAGYYIRGASSQGAGNKAYYCGGNVAAEGWGFFFEGPSTLEEGCNQWVACNAQDNKADGYRFLNAQRRVVSGSASSNGTSSAGTYVGVRLDGISSLNIIDIVCTERVAEPNNTQRNALSISENCASNKIRITHGATAASVVKEAIKSGSDPTGGNDISINGMGGFGAPGYAAEKTFDPYAATTFKVGALTGKFTVKAPANAHVGCPLRIILVQDGTGGREVVWNEVFSTTYANTGNTKEKKLIIEFVYDGSKWQQTYISQSATAGTYWI